MAALDGALFGEALDAQGLLVLAAMGLATVLALVLASSLYIPNVTPFAGVPMLPYPWPLLGHLASLGTDRIQGAALIARPACVPGVPGVLPVCRVCAMCAGSVPVVC